jgi:hypothetical protein
MGMVKEPQGIIRALRYLIQLLKGTLEALRGWDDSPIQTLKELL